MHPAFVYIVVQVLEDESRRVSQPSARTRIRLSSPIRVPWPSSPPGGRRSFAARFRGRAASRASAGSPASSRRLASEG